MRGLMSAGGYWETVCSTIEVQERLLASLIAQEPTPLPQATVARLLTSGYFFPYVRNRAPRKSNDYESVIGTLSVAFPIF